MHLHIIQVYLKVWLAKLVVLFRADFPVQKALISKDTKQYPWYFSASVRSLMWHRKRTGLSVSCGMLESIIDSSPSMTTFMCHWVRKFWSQRWFLMAPTLKFTLEEGHSHHLKESTSSIDEILSLFWARLWRLAWNWKDVPNQNHDLDYSLTCF